AAFKLASVEVVTASDNTPPERKLTRSVVSLTPMSFVVGEEAYRLTLQLLPLQEINLLNQEKQGIYG
ncbi:MAG: hypothetical protein AB4063_21490, partial [Crocosphaera sp.]